MKRFNKLIIKGDTEKLRMLLNIIKSNLPDNWSERNDNLKSYSESTGISQEDIICLETPEHDGMNGILWGRIVDGVFEVLNIVPTSHGSLGYKRYNSILDSFVNDILSKNHSDLGVSIDYQNEPLDLKQMIGDLTFEKLSSWEGSCNQSTGNTNPYDFERWAQFVITAYRSKSNLTPDLLFQWLVEERGWNEDLDTTHKMMLDFEYSLELLEANDKY